MTQSPSPGTALALGTTNVVFFVDDGNGNTNFSTASVSVINQLPVFLAASFVTNGGFKLCFTGPAGASYRLMDGSNANSASGAWTVLTNGIFATNILSYTDFTVTNIPVRYFRLVMP